MPEHSVVLPRPSTCFTRAAASSSNVPRQVCNGRLHDGLVAVSALPHSPRHSIHLPSCCQLPLEAPLLLASPCILRPTFVLLALFLSAQLLAALRLVALLLEAELLLAALLLLTLLIVALLLLAALLLAAELL